MTLRNFGNKYFGLSILNTFCSQVFCTCILNTFVIKYFYLYFKYFYDQVFVLILKILLKSIFPITGPRPTSRMLDYGKLKQGKISD